MHEIEPGYLRLFSLYRVPVYFHWSFPIGGILISLYGKGDLEQTAYYIFSYSILILVHELGHLLAARYYKLEVFSIKISGAGGMCRCGVPESFRSAFLLYRGGLLVQIIFFVIAASYLSFYTFPESKLGFCLAITFTLVNVIMLVINLIPSKTPGGQPTDGYVLWSLLRAWRDRPS